MKNQVVVFTQTYANNRQELFHFHNGDSVDVQFRNSFDKCLYSFHNSPFQYIQEVLQQNPYFHTSLNNLEVIQYNQMGYTETFQQTLLKCKEEGYKYMVFLQDDVFSLGTENSLHLEKLITFIQTQDFQMLHLENYSFAFETDISYAQPPNMVYQDGDFKVYDTNSTHFTESGQWAMDDSPFVASVDFLLKLYDTTYVRHQHIWPAEIYMNDKCNAHPIQRLVCSHKFFRRYNAVGPNSWNRVQELHDLKLRFSNI